MKTRRLSEAERLDWLRLARTSGVGPVSFAGLTARFSTAAEAIDALPRLARRGGRAVPPKPPARADAEAELERLHALGGRLICCCEPEFPPLLAALDPPPPLIQTLGPLDLGERRACAIVGSRQASAVGQRFAREIAAGLGAAGVAVVSGLARGVDAAAHAGALEAGTVAVVAGGVANVYPPENAVLRDMIAEQGLIVSEARPDHAPTARDFPRRNRLISGLSLGVVVIEAAERSGSLITARLAAEQGREVMAAPGSPLDPRARGGNRLIRDGAALIETVDDVLDVLAGVGASALTEPAGADYEDERPSPQEMEAEIDRIREALMSALSPSPASRDELARAVGARAEIVLAALVELELAGRCQLDPDGSVRAAYPET